jgi:hypothetical protein
VPVAKLLSAEIVLPPVAPITETLTALTEASGISEPKSTSESTLATSRPRREPVVNRDIATPPYSDGRSEGDSGVRHVRQETETSQVKGQRLAYQYGVPPARPKIASGSQSSVRL